MTTRAEHMAWCKERALEYADSGDAGLAMSSLIQDRYRLNIMGSAHSRAIAKAVAQAAGQERF